MIKPIITDKKQLIRMCIPVSNIEGVAGVIDDLRDTFNQLVNCAGLAAPQINYRVRVIIVNVQGSPTIMVNPKYIERKGKLVLGREGCFSVPDTIKKPVPVRRYNKIQVGYYNEDGDYRITRYKSFEARLIQHEMDHLDGRLIS